MQKQNVSPKWMFILFFSFMFQPLLSAKNASHHIQTFQVTNLVSNLPGVAAQTDPRLLNPWGLTFDPRGNLVVVNNNESFLATSYAPNGDILDFAVNVIPSPTAVVSNHSRCDFRFCLAGLNTTAQFCTTTVRPAQYLFATEVGTILAYNNEVDPDNAILVIDRSAAGAVYTGLTLVKFEGRQFIFAADFFNGQIDVFDNQFNFLVSFTDQTIPADYGPYNLRTFDGLIYATYAKRVVTDEGVDSVTGHDLGYVDIFCPKAVLESKAIVQPSGPDNFVFLPIDALLKRLITGDRLNAPYGLEIAPPGYGCFSGALLVGNFGDGRINAYSPRSGKFLGELRNTDETPIVINGLWSISFDDFLKPRSRKNKCKRSTALFFISGPDGETNGLVGVITPTAPTQPQP